MAQKTTPPKTRPVRIQDLEPGMKVERINDDLEFVYVEVERVEPRQEYPQTYPRSVTKAYRVHLVGSEDPASEHRPFTVRPRQSVTVLDEEA